MGQRSESVRAYAVQAGGGEPAAAPGGARMWLKATSAATGGAFSVLESVDPPGFATSLHQHPPAEAWYVVEGRYDYYVDGTWFRVETDGFVYVPGGVPHGLRAGPEGGRKLLMIAPPGMEEFFRDIHARFERGGDGGAEPDGLAELAARHQITDLGELPAR